MSFYNKAVQGTSIELAKKRFGWKDKISYALGDFGCNMSFALNSYLMTFWTQYMGISLEIWAILILCLKIWDAINDPLIGGLIDFIKPKEGQSKFKPWIFWGSFALVFTGALCFIPVKTAPLWIKLIICCLGYLLWDMAYTIVNVPYGSLNSVISNNSAERSQLSTWRSIGAMIANIIIMLGVPALIFDSNNNLLGERLIIVGVVLGVVGIIAFQVLLRGTTERIFIDYNRQREGKKYNYFKSLGAFFTNRAAVSMTINSIFQLLALAFMQTLSGIFIQITFPGMSKFSGIISLMGFLPAILFVPFIVKIVNRFGKKEASTWPLLLGVAGGVLLLCLPIETFGATVGMLLWVLVSFFIGVSIAFNSMVAWAMVADCIDYHELKTNRREEGVVYATYSFGRKFAQGVGASLVSALLLLTTYKPDIDMSQQAAGTSSQIRLLLAIAYIVGFAIQFFVLLFGYNLNKKTVMNMEEELAKRSTHHHEESTEKTVEEESSKEDTSQDDGSTQE